MQDATARRIEDTAAWPVPSGIRLAPITVGRLEAIERLLDLAFGYDRHQRTAYRLREGVAALPDASFVALDEGDGLAGSIQTWPIALTGVEPAAGADAVPLWLVGPIAVHPDRQGRGIGRAMLAAALEAIDGTGLPALLVGDPGYYAPFGFAAARAAHWGMPGPVERHRLLLRARPGMALPGHGAVGPRR